MMIVYLIAPCDQEQLCVIDGEFHTEFQSQVETWIVAHGSQWWRVSSMAVVDMELETWH